MSSVVDAIRHVAQHKERFTSDDVWPHFVPPPANPNVIGAGFREANRLGIIRPTGQFVMSARHQAHRRRVQVWESAMYARRPRSAAYATS